uniref:hypothetical protein n=1 Tax=uncultured Caulobacter sp. TaxID=158749 RepID=UPI0025E5A8AF|nr:hypothetical protein [uncultured Caulobacter sp.]
MKTSPETSTVRASVQEALPKPVQTQGHPVHAVLGGQDRQAFEGMTLVAGEAVRVGEAGGQLGLPGPSEGSDAIFQEFGIIGAEGSILTERRNADSTCDNVVNSL